MAEEVSGKAPRRKVLAQTGGAGAGLQVGILVVYALEQLSGHGLPDKVEASAVGLAALAVGFLAGYLVPEEG